MNSQMWKSFYKIFYFFFKTPFSYLYSHFSHSTWGFFKKLFFLLFQLILVIRWLRLLANIFNLFVCLLIRLLACMLVYLLIFFCRRWRRRRFLLHWHFSPSFILAFIYIIYWQSVMNIRLILFFILSFLFFVRKIYYHEIFPRQSYWTHLRFFS